MPWISKEDVDRLAAVDLYYCDRRWLFYDQVIGFLFGKGVTDLGLLEVGPHRLPLSTRSSVIDIKIRPEIEREGRPFVLEGDAADPALVGLLEGKIETAVACQVFEHLEKPLEVWRNLRRVARRICITMPWRWRENKVHNRDLRDLAEWTGGELPETLVKVRGSRVLAWYEF